MSNLSPFLLVNDLTMEAFVGLLRGYECPDNPVLMGFSVSESCIRPYVFDEGFLAAAEQGRIFSLEGEIRWRRVGEKMRVVYLGARNFTDILTDRSDSLKNLEAKRSELILWGVRTDREQEWIEQHVPHRFSYPVSSDKFSRGRVAVEVENWFDGCGVPRFSRYCCLKEIKGEG